MKRAGRRAAAVLALTAFLSPGIAAGFVAVHLAHDHDHATALETRTLASALHGHSHADGTAEHEHAFVPSGAAHGSGTFWVSASTFSVADRELFGHGLLESLACSLPSEHGHSPPRSLEAFAILRI